jgi:hypothetical protein
MRCKAVSFLIFMALLTVAFNAFSQENKTTVLQGINGQCSAFIDNQAIDLAGTQTISATLVEPAVKGEERSKAVLNISVTGSPKNSKSEAIFISIPMPEPSLAGAQNMDVRLNHDGLAYALANEKNNSVEVTDFIWSRDHKSFIISLSFNCTMYTAVFLEGGKGDLNLRGKVLRVKVMVPGAASASN